ncbi:hypothetical protein JIQ42_04724 [Leishmania sp. Namibia]|uniref:hypothetical protein n=1 Tax=Leishmania sp. Namibia TaxID=2802991 RepID=UPI001B5AB42A|nr:hypothetical protein JIQ42_04724 [Leishmania sp. Namibia]
MDIDLFLLFEATTVGIFGGILLTIIGMSIFACVQRGQRVKERQQECENLVAMVTEKQQELQWLTGIDSITDNADLFGDVNFNVSWTSRGSQW